VLSACGGNNRGINQPNQPSQPYDPNQGSIYTPAPDTHGYNPDQTQGQGITYSVVKNTFLRMDPELGIFIKHLEGRLEPKRQGDPIIFDDVKSFVFHVYQGQLVLDEANITLLKNKYTFNYPDSPLKDIQINFTPGRIKMSGKMKQLIAWIPFTMEGTVRPTPEGKIIMIPDRIVALGIPSKGLMDLIGLDTAKLINVNSDRGVELQGNNIILDPNKLFPPPKMQSKVVAVNVIQGKMNITFGGNQRVPRRQLPDPSMQNYMHVYGGNLLMMNELHRGGELQMVDMDPSNPFDFYLGEYKRHLKAGYVKVMNDLGTLITLMPDYTKIQSTQVWDRYPGGKPKQQQNYGYQTYTSGKTSAPTGYQNANQFWKTEQAWKN